MSFSPSTTPIVAEAQATRAEAEYQLDQALNQAAAMPLEILFFGIPPMDASSAAADGAVIDPSLTPEDRMARRRHALGLPDHVDRRVELRQASRRREFELSQGLSPQRPTRLSSQSNQQR